MTTGSAQLPTGKADTGPTVASAVMCANTDHHFARKATFRVTWPTNRYRPTTACGSCAAWILREQAREAGGVTFEVVPDAR